MGEQGAIARPVATATNGHHETDEQTDEDAESAPASDTTEDGNDE
jgi:hypothetical protein